jgi:uncharacterized protein DUF6090
MKAIFSHIKEHWIKYSLETLVVMAGILGAYALNNWNEVRKDNKIELEIYAELNSSLRSDSVKLRETIEKLQLCNEGLQKVIFKECEDIIKSENLENLLNNIMYGAWSFFPKYGAWEQITNNNQMYLINADGMISKLVELYDYKYQRYINIDNIIDDKFQYLMMGVVAGDIGYLPDVTGNFEDTINVENFRLHFNKLSHASRESINISAAALYALIEIQIEVNELLTMTRNELEK